MRKNKYLDVFGKDFSSQSAAYKHFQSLKAEMLEKKLIGSQVGFFTEETPIKKSQMYSLLERYGDLNYWKRHEIENFREDIEEFWLDNVVLNLSGIALNYQRTNRHNEENCPHCISYNRPNPNKEFRIRCIRSFTVAPEDISACNMKKAMTCFPGSSESSDKEKIQKAFRFGIREDTKLFRKLNETKCNHCSQTTAEDQLEVDHKDISFKDLTKQFTEDRNYTEEYLMTQIEDRNNIEMWLFTNKDIEDQWKSFHKEKALLQLLCLECHKKKTKKERAV